MDTRVYTPSHPILFVFDPSNESMEVPAYDRQNTACSNAACISIRTIADVDGDVTVNLTETVAPEVARSSVEVFRGTIETPGKKVAVVTAENQTLVEMSLAGPKARIRVLVDDEAHPAQIWIEAC